MMSDTIVTEAASREGVELFPLSSFTFGPSSRAQPGALLLSYAGFDRGAIRAGVRRLRKALEACRVG
jgi:DNA-binding transcriptional MocR family regulator